MPRLLIGNEFNEDRAGIADARRKKTAWWTQRLLWYAQDDDVLVLAVAPEEAYLEYVTSLTGAKHSSLTVVVPPPGALGVGVLTADRLSDPVFLDDLRKALDGRTIDRVVSLHPDVSVSALARAVGVDAALPGRGFLDQGGGRLVNSKAAFRAIAGGVGVPLPDGGVCAAQADAERLIGGLLDQGHPVMLKHDFRAGGRGNEIVSPVDGVLPVGAHRSVTVPDRTALRAYLAQRWDWLTGHGQTQVVVERYFPGSSAVFAEFSITEEGPVFAGQGEMVSAPLAAAEIIPAPGLTPELTAELVEHSRRLCVPLHAMGYRGMLSADAILTPDGNIVFTEYNGRFTGSTHIYGIVGKHLVGEDYATSRVLLEREGWPVPSFRSALDRLNEAGLAFDSARKTGVVLVMPYNTSDSTIRYCAVAETLEAARACQDQVEALFAEITDKE